MRWSVLALLIIVGCGSPAAKDKSTGSTKKSEEEIKQAFAALQSAIKAKDADKIWELLAKDTRADAEREGKAVTEAFNKFSDKDKAEYEKKVAIPAKELMDMTGRGYVKSSMFLGGETGEMPDSKLDKVVVTDESTATVHYIEAGERPQHESRSVLREDGQWRFMLPVPPAVLGWGK